MLMVCIKNQLVISYEHKRLWLMCLFGGCLITFSIWIKRAHYIEREFAYQRMEINYCGVTTFIYSFDLNLLHIWINHFHDLNVSYHSYQFFMPLQKCWRWAVCFVLLLLQCEVVNQKLMLFTKKYKSNFT